MAREAGAGEWIELVACGILRKEIRYLAEKNGWPVRPHFLPSALHVDFGRLRQTLERSLAATSLTRRLVFYGACHPLMDGILAGPRAPRTPGQNCVEICLGAEVFARELAAGAFFLFEDWARHWDRVTGGPGGMPPAVMREIFAVAHSHLLGLRTPCSGDFTAAAEEVSRQTSLELRWMDVGLERLEETLDGAIRRVMEEPL